MFVRDKEIIRELAKELAEIAALPVQEEKRALWLSTGNNPQGYQHGGL